MIDHELWCDLLGTPEVRNSLVMHSPKLPTPPPLRKKGEVKWHMILKARKGTLPEV